MIVDVRKGARGVGRFLTRQTEGALQKIRKIDDAYKDLNRASGGLVELGLQGTGIKPAFQTIVNPLVTTITAANYLGRGLSTLGKTDWNLQNAKNLGSGIQDIGQAYVLASTGNTFRPFT